MTCLTVLVCSAVFTVTLSALISRPCHYQGIVYKNGQQYKSADGCTSCSCSDGTMTCLDVNCASQKSSHKSCHYNGQTYQDGEGFKSADGCNGCGCNDGMVICTELACAPVG